MSGKSFKLPNGATAKLQTLTPQEIARLSQDEKNRVYTFEYDSVQENLTPVQVKVLMDRAMAVFRDVRKKDPQQTDVNIRKYIIDCIDGMKSFSQTHKRIFEFVTDRTKTDKEIARIYTLLKMKEETDKKQLNEKQSQKMVCEYLQEECKLNMTVEEYKKVLEERERLEKEQQGPVVRNAAGQIEFGLSDAPETL